MKLNFLKFVPLIFLSFIEGENTKHTFESGSIKCYYETFQNRLDGNYVSFYKNGNKKAEGKFDCNYRTGTWTVWDSTGRVRMQRNYTDPFTFKRIIPVVPKDKLIELLNIPQYTINYNKDGYIEYFRFRDGEVLWVDRIMRMISPESNSILFENNRLFSIINKNILNQNITPFQVNRDVFLEENTLSDIDTTGIRVIGYKILESCLFDKERLVFEYRINSIYPVVIKNQDTIDYYYVDFEQIRNILAQEKILQTKGLPSKIKTFDDLFFYRYFYGQIYDESNFHNGHMESNMKVSEIESNKIEISLIEHEHDIWISLTE